VSNGLGLSMEGGYLVDFDGTGYVTEIVDWSMCTEGSGCSCEKNRNSRYSWLLSGHIYCLPRVIGYQSLSSKFATCEPLGLVSHLWRNRGAPKASGGLWQVNRCCAAEGSCESRRAVAKTAVSNRTKVRQKDAGTDWEVPSKWCCGCVSQHETHLCLLQ